MKELEEEEENSSVAVTSSCHSIWTIPPAQLLAGSPLAAGTALHRTPLAGHSTLLQDTRGGASGAGRCSAGPRLLHTQLHNETVSGGVDQRQPHREMPVKACLSSPLCTEPSPQMHQSPTSHGQRTRCWRWQ
ncbi:hypothetical protein E2C01_046005 [Portunus trituberculatus]|uniref:Uncharacterized protein n=1 Tax=Portunus trituberculatus TaxID=210409 RepID=A0A5B7G6G4_PORTR|nr:hypothetical protein [Portunus trituberculatus]